MASGYLAGGTLLGCGSNTPRFLEVSYQAIYTVSVEKQCLSMTNIVFRLKLCSLYHLITEFGSKNSVYRVTNTVYHPKRCLSVDMQS